jgi:NADPH:quinone reductase-like Zn-dependent oxidoreductase
VLITGVWGGVGTLAVQLAKTVGAQITGVCNTMKEDLVRSFGAADACQRVIGRFGRYRQRLDGQRGSTKMVSFQAWRA